MSRALVALALALFALLSLAPIAVMLGTVESGDLARLADARTLTLLGRTLLLGLGAAGVAMALGAPYGWLVARGDVPLARAWRILVLAPLLLPPLFLAMTWSQISSLRGAPAAVLLLGLATFPLVALFTIKAAGRVDGRAIDAAALIGGPASVLAAEWKLLAPGALTGACLAFTFAVNDFAVPDFVSSVGPKFNVYADEVFSTWQTGHDSGLAVVRALPLVVLSLAALLPALRLRRRGALASLGGDFRGAAPLALGPARWAAGAFCLGALALGAGVPLARLLFEAGGGSRGFALTKMHAAFALALETAREDLRASLLLSLAAAALCVPLGLILAHAIERARHGRWFEPVAILPLAVPAVLFGIGEVVLWNHGPTADFYDSALLVALLYAGRFVPFAILVASGAVAMLARAGEDAAELAGAGPIRRLSTIVAPPLAPALLGSAVLVFVFAMRELDAAILVPAANGTAIFRVFNLVHFGRDDHVAALALLVVFFIALPGLAWALLARRRLEFLP